MSHLSRITALALIVVGCMTYNIASAMAESSITDNSKTNVVFRFGINAVSGNDYTDDTLVYNKKTDTFDTYVPIETEPDFGIMWNDHGKLRTELHSDEIIVTTQVSFRLSTGKQVFVKWSGKRPLSIHRKINGHKASLIVATVAIHSPKLPNQKE